MKKNKYNKKYITTGNDFADQQFAKAVYVVEASRTEQLDLWVANNKKETWRQKSEGSWFQIGVYNRQPVCVAFTFAEINGKIVVFYDSTSNIVNWELIRKWIKKRCNPYDINNRQAQCDAMNFGQFLMNYGNKKEI